MAEQRFAIRRAVPRTLSSLLELFCSELLCTHSDSFSTPVVFPTFSHFCQQQLFVEQHQQKQFSCSGICIVLPPVVVAESPTGFRCASECKCVCVFLILLSRLLSPNSVLRTSRVTVHQQPEQQQQQQQQQPLVSFKYLRFFFICRLWKLTFDKSQHTHTHLLTHTNTTIADTKARKYTEKY